MKFHLDGIDVNLQIGNYRKSTVAGWHDEWCDVYLAIDSKVISYEERGNFILCQELETLYEKIGALLEGNLKNREHIFLADSVLEFRLRPAVKGEDADEDMDIDLYLIVNLSDDDGTVTANSINILFGRESIMLLHKYIGDLMELALVRKKVEYEFEYYIDYGDGNYSRVRTWKEDLYEEEARMLEAGLKKGLHFDEMEGIEALKQRLVSSIKNVEADNLRDAEIWTEEYFNEYGTDDPFKVFELVIDVKDR